MLTPEEVASIWTGVRAMLKPHYRVDRPWAWADNKAKRPEFWPGYGRACDERTRLEPHILHGYFPEEVFRHRAPNASDKEMEYMRHNFKQVTLVVYADAENTIKRALSDSNWTVIYGDDAEQVDEAVKMGLSEYINTGIKEHGSVADYVRSIVLRLKAVDPMGLVVVRPDALPVVAQDDGTMVIDPDGALQPMPHYVDCTKVYGFSLDRWYLYLTDERSEVRRGDRTERVGLVLHLVDDTWFYRIEQTGKAEDFAFEVVQWWEHGCGFPPASHLKGTPIVDDGGQRWQSFYLPAVEPLDQVLLDSSYLQASKAKVAFPHMVVLDDPCSYMDQTTGAACFNGTLEWTADGEVKRMTCPSCKGSGSQARLGPLGEVRVRQKTTGEGGAEAKVGDALTFVSPPTETLTFLREEIEYNLRQARNLLHLHSEAPIVGGDAPTATQVGVDVRATQAFVAPIANQVLDLTEFIIDCIGAERYAERYPGVTITRPSTYDVRTETDLIAEFKVATTTMPPPVAEGILWQYIKARYGHSPDQLKTWQTIAAADTIFATNTATIQQLLAQRIIEPWQVALHQQSFAIYDQLQRDGTITGDIATDAAAMVAAAKAMVPTAQAPAARITEVIAR